MLKNFLTITLLVFFSSNILFAENIKNVQVTGNKRLSTDTIEVIGQIEKNSDYNEERINILIKELYSSDFFKDIDIIIKNETLFINVVENPIIEELKINGIKKKEFREFIEENISLKNRKSFVEFNLKSDLNMISNILKRNGYYFSKVDASQVFEESTNSIKLIIDIELGNKATINNINFIGDKIFKDRKLFSIITSEKDMFWKFISQRIYIDDQRLSLDKRLLENFYKNEGYYDVVVEDSFVEFKDNNSFDLTFNINAGTKYKINKINLDLPDDFNEKYFSSIKKIIKKLENKDYSLNKIEKIIKEVDKIAQSKQYEFIDVSFKEEKLENNMIDILINFSESEKFYVERIDIKGNQFTLEETIRHSLIVDEGDPLNEILLNKSIDNLRGRNFFKSVKTKIKDGSDKNFKVIDIELEEQPTGEISLGAGAGTSGGTIGGGVKENNFLGKGISLDAGLQISEETVEGKFVYANPNFNYTDNTLFTTVKSSKTDRVKDFGYETRDIGFSLGSKFEQFENLFFSPEIDLTYEKLDTTSKASANLRKQEGNYADAYFNYGLTYDLRDQKFQTKDGYLFYFNQELPVISENNELKNSFEYATYHQISNSFVTKLSFYGSAVNSISDDDVRISKRLYIPYRKLRGFEKGKVGPKDGSDYVGGNYVSSINASTTLPKLFPDWENTDFIVFLDAGNVWGIDYDSSIDDRSTIRSAVGFGVDLITPVGPLNFSYSAPLTKASSDKTESFRFNLGTTF